MIERQLSVHTMDHERTTLIAAATTDETENRASVRLIGAKKDEIFIAGKAPAALKRQMFDQHLRTK